MSLDYCEDCDCAECVHERGLLSDLARLRDRVRVLEDALGRIRSEAQDNLIAAIADDALDPKVLVESQALEGWK